LRFRIFPPPFSPLPKGGIRASFFFPRPEVPRFFLPLEVGFIDLSRRLARGLPTPSFFCPLAEVSRFDLFSPFSLLGRFPKVFFFFRSPKKVSLTVPFPPFFCENRGFPDPVFSFLPGIVIRLNRSRFFLSFSGPMWEVVRCFLFFSSRFKDDPYGFCADERILCGSSPPSFLAGHEGAKNPRRFLPLKKIPSDSVPFHPPFLFFREGKGILTCISSLRFARRGFFPLLSSLSLNLPILSHQTQEAIRAGSSFPSLCRPRNTKAPPFLSISAHRSERFKGLPDPPLCHGEG